MALQLQYETPQGFTTNTAYVRIINFAGTKESMRVGVDMYKDYQARLDGKTPMFNSTITLELEYGATMQQMYTALKLLPEFAGATDV